MIHLRWTACLTVKFPASKIFKSHAKITQSSRLVPLDLFFLVNILPCRRIVCGRFVSDLTFRDMDYCRLVYNYLSC